LAELVDAYFGTIPDAFRRPNSQLYLWLRDRLREREPKGVIVAAHVWCDRWRGEAQRLREWLGVPMLLLELDGASGVDGRAQSRLDAFLEVL
jgi:benzoyl-CoA reductase/2-hydroxyglutaryl-CoA dehydratase subunit BcrC/BadD/HgdB